MTTEGIDPAMHTLSETPHNVPARRPEDDALDRLGNLFALLATDQDDESDYVYVMRSEVREAEDAADTVREALERLTEERNALREVAKIMLDRAESAEAEVRRLTEGLRDLRTECKRSETGLIFTEPVIDRIDALLSASPSDGGGAK